ncbi:MAG: hypothetical protein AB1646_19630 [Thermodesulfobacteriota bacterium]
MNERLTIQQGLFLYPCHHEKTIEEILQSYTDVNNPRNIRKIVCNGGMRTDGISDLFSMNMSRAVLFPGIDGFAQSLKNMLLGREENLFTSFLLRKQRVSMERDLAARTQRQPANEPEGDHASPVQEE